MGREWILVIDSGIGGLWTLNKIRTICPHENYLYFMDKLNAPYGNKSARFLKIITKRNIKKLIDLYDIKLVVFACNTLSSVVYDYIKGEFTEKQFIKIEPFVEPSLFKHSNTLVIATKNTIKRNKNLKKYAEHNNIFLHGFPSLAKKIDDAKGDYQKLLPYLKKELSSYSKLNIKNIVLGCTHFNYIKPQLKEIFGNVAFFENSENVAKNVKTLLKKTKKYQNKSSFPKKKQKNGQFLLLYKI